MQHTLIPLQFDSARWLIHTIQANENKIQPLSFNASHHPHRHEAQGQISPNFADKGNKDN